MKKIVLFIISLLVVNSVLNAQKEGLTSINKGDLKAYMTFFASDEMAGRETGTPENDASALFIKCNLMRIGLKPMSDGDYLQKMPFIETSVNEKERSLKIYDNTGKVTFSTDSLVSFSQSSKTLEIEGNVVFAGYGYFDSTGYNDLKGIDLKNKIILIMTRTPESAYSNEKSKVFDNRVEGKKLGSIFMGGPKAVLLVYDPKNDFKDAYASGLAGMIPANSVAPSGQGKGRPDMPFLLAFITRYTADQLLKSTGNNLAQMQENIRREGKPVSTEIQGITTLIKIPVRTRDFFASNVIGIAEGSDPVLRNECVIYTAHFDHTGKNRDGKVNNGADDDASGSMALLEVAEAFTKLKKKPLRTVVFAWVNGEEKGLLGSQYYADNPVIPMGKTLVDFNLDMVGRSKLPSDTGKFAGYDLDVTQPGEIMIYTAHESSELMTLLKSAAQESGIKVIDKGKDLGFGGSDHESFWAKGVPAIFFHSGIHADLHNVGDDVEKIDFDKMEKVSKMVFLLGYKVANQKNRIVVDNPLKPQGQ
jgi:hypothetical protein